MGNRASSKVVPVTVLTGFLGSGKTTLLNHILSSTDHGLRFAIVENEFGDVGVDDKVISESADEEIIEVMNGCICCTVRADLVVTLKKLYKKVKNFDAVIIETTGLADPAPVAQTFFVDDGIQRMYRLDGIITVVDAKHILQHLDEKKPEGVENESVEQLAFADRILLNKTDLVAEPAELDQIEGRIKAINGQAPIFRCQHGNVEAQHLVNLHAFDIERALQMDSEFLDTSGEHQHDESISSVSCRFDGELHVLKLQAWIEDLIKTKGQDLFRYKGVLAVKGVKAKYVFQGVHMLFSGDFYDARWKDTETRECRFVFIGRNLDKQALMKGIIDCKIEGELRFKVGDEVEINVGEGQWSRGKVIKEWEQGHPYTVQLDDTGGEGLIPLDDGRFLRAVAS